MGTDSGGVKLTYEDYLSIPPDGLRHEIVDGEHFVNAAPNPRHQLVTGEFYRQLATAIHDPRLGTVFISPIDVQLSENDVVQPDIVVVLAPRKHIITATRLLGAPDLVIETLSKSTKDYDRRIKKQRYERFGVPEFWIVDPDRDELEQHVLDGDEYTCLPPAGARVTTRILPDVTVYLPRAFQR